MSQQENFPAQLLEELAAIKRLDEQAGRLERHASGPSVEALVTEERARSHQYGGRSVFGAEPHAANSRDAFTPENARGGGQRDDQQLRYGRHRRGAR